MADDVYKRLGIASPDDGQDGDVYDRLGIAPSAPAPVEAPSESSFPSFRDLAAKAGAGIQTGFVTVPGQALKMLTGKDAMVRAGQEGAEYFRSLVSPEGQRRMNAPLIKGDGSLGDYPLSSIAGTVAESAPQMAAIALTGGPISRAAMKGNMGAPLGSAVGKIAGKRAGAFAQRTAEATLPLAAAEGFQAGMAGAAQVGDEARAKLAQMSDEQVSQVPGFAEANAVIDPAVPAGERMGLIRAQIANAAEQQAALQGGTWTGGIGLATGAGVLGPAIRRLAGKQAASEVGQGFFKTVAKGAAREAGQEIPQSGGEEYLANLALQQSVDPNQNLWEGVPNAMALGGAAGFVTGGSVGAISSAAGQQPAGSASGSLGQETGDQQAPVETAGVESSPLDPEAGPLSKAAVTGQVSGAIPTNIDGGPTDAPVPIDPDSELTPEQQAEMQRDLALTGSQDDGTASVLPATAGGSELEPGLAGPSGDVVDTDLGRSGGPVGRVDGTPAGGLAPGAVVSDEQVGIAADQVPERPSALEQQGLQEELDAEMAFAQQGKVKLSRKASPPPTADDPEISRLPEPARIKLAEIYQFAANKKPEFDQAVEEISQIVGGQPLIPPMKGTKRAVDKIESEYQGDPTRIKDLVRATVAVDSTENATVAVQQINQRMKVLPEGARNLFEEGRDPVDGYRDAKFNVDLGDGVVGEVQVNIPEILEAKEGRGHDLYEARSEIERAAEKEGRDFTAQERVRYDRLNGEMRQLYGAAYQAALARTSSTSSANATGPSELPSSLTNAAVQGEALRGGSTSQAATTGVPANPMVTGTPSTEKNSADSGIDPSIPRPRFARGKAKTVEVDGVKRPSINSNGKPIAANEKATKNFWRWFGDSKTVDEAGQPQVMYHGTGADFDTFDSAEMLFVAAEPEFASDFAPSVNPGGNVMPVFVKVNNPFDFRNAEHRKLVLDHPSLKGSGLVDSLETPLARVEADQSLAKGDFDTIELPEIQDAIRALGFDGFYIREAFLRARPAGRIRGKKSFSINIGVFDPKQIKSAIGNQGTFSPDTDNITFKRGEKAKGKAAEEPAQSQSFDIGAERGKRKTIKTKSPLSLKETRALGKSVAKEVKDTSARPALVKAAQRKAKEIKAKHPKSAGWAELEVVGGTVATDKKGSTVNPEFKKIQYGFQKEPGTKGLPKAGSAWEKSVADQMHTFIKDIYDRAGKGDKVAKGILSHSGWYRNVNEILRRDLGGSADYFADLLGATSPNTPVRTNWNFTVDFIKRFAKGDFDKDMSRFVKYLDEGGQIGKYPAANKVKQVSGKLYGMNSTNAMLATANLWREVKAGQAPKARNFARNLVGQSNMATIDVWAARMLRRAANVVAKGSFPRIPVVAETAVTGKWNAKATSVTGEFGFGARVFDQVSQMLAKEGIEVSPPDLQAIAWFAEKELWTRENWTSKQGEGGSFEEEIAKKPMGRFLAGWSIQQGEKIPEPGDVSKSQGRVLKVLNKDDSVISARVLPTYGLYGGVVEESFDTEWTVIVKDHNPGAVMTEIAKLAKENNQTDIFVSRVLDPQEDSPNARPGVELYFETPQALEAVQPILDKFVERGQDGFTMVVDPRATVAGMGNQRLTGVRLQYVPEISARWDNGARASMMADGGIEKILAEKTDALNALAAEVSGAEGVAFASAFKYDTLVLGQENYDAFINRRVARSDQAPGSKGWPKQSVREGLEKAIAGYEGEQGQDGGTGVSDAGSTATETRFKKRSRLRRDAKTDARRDGGVGSPPVREDGKVELKHWSKRQGLTSLDPSKHGTGISGAESKRKASDPGNWVDRTYFGLQTGRSDAYKKESSLGAHEYTVGIEADKLYDYQADPDGLFDKGNGFDNAYSMYEKRIKEAGYQGYWTNHPQLGMTAAVFEVTTPEVAVNPEVERVQQTVDAITSGWKNAPKISVLGSFDDAPAAIRAEAGRQDSQGAEDSPVAAFANGQVYLFADQNLTPKRITESVFHEALGHYGLRGAFGSQLDVVLDEVSSKHRMLVGRKAKEYGLDVSKVEDRRLATEEVLAELAETNPQLGIVKRVVAKIRALLRSMGFDIALSDNDIIANIIIPARQFVQDSRTGKPTSGVRFSRAGDAVKRAVDKVTAGPDRSPYLGDLTPAQERAAKNVGAIVQPQTVSERLDELGANLGMKIRQGLVDEFAAIKAISPEAYIKARMSKGTDGALEAMFLYGTPEFKDGIYDVKVTEEGGFAKILADLDGEHDRFLLWVAAQRAEMLKKQGRENLFTDEDISDLKGLSKGRAMKYARALKALNKYNDALLKIAVESGLIDEKARQLFRDQPYVPFYRVMEDESVPAGQTFSGGLTNKQAFKKLKGGTQKLNQDLLANMLHNWAHLLQASAQNSAAVQAMDAAEELGIVTKVPAGTKKAVKVMRDGNTNHYLIDDPLVYEAVSAISYSVPGFFKPFSTLKRWLTIGVTANPSFKIRNLIRDSLSAVGTAPLSGNVVGNVVKGAQALNKDSQTYASLLASGGIIRFGTMLEGHRAHRAHRIIEKAVKDNTLLDKSGVQRLMDMAGDAITFYNELGDKSENANRAAIYTQMKAKGYSHADAAFASRDLLDFSMGGRWPIVRFLTHSVPFMNARLQGLYKLGRAGREDPKRLAAMVGAVALASTALMLAYKDDEDWKKREDWDRDTYWWFKIGDKAFRIPKPFEIGAMGTVAERSMELLVSDEMTGKRYANRIGDMFGQTLALSPLSMQVVKPFIDLYANKDSFTNRPIEGLAQQRLAPSDRVTNRTTEAARFLGRLGLPNPVYFLQGKYQQLSPVQVDHLLRAYFGWLGSSTATMIDTVARPLAGRGERPDRELRDIFLAGNFVESLPTGSSRYVTQMYEQAREVKQAYASWQQAKKMGDVSRAAQLYEKNYDKIRRYRQVNRTTRRMSELNAKLRKVEADRNMSGLAKRRRINELRRQIDQTSRRAQQ